ncbi:MAG: PASTA domain-containing protein [Clostridiales bacterium]|nr:PASTA domain-containing protein [Clostridiales bacterium]
MGKVRCMSCMSEYDDTQIACPYCGYSSVQGQREPMCLPVETILNSRYAAGVSLGSSDFEITYLAWDYQDGIKVVIKEYFPKALAYRSHMETEVSAYDGDKFEQYETGLKAFLSEAESLCTISGDLPGIVRFRDAFIENSTAYLVSEFVDGTSLDRVISDGGMPWTDVLEIMSPLINSMALIHENNIINYIIAPDNIIMSRTGEARLSSFGASRFQSVITNKDLSLMMKPGFSAEELYHSDTRATPSADVYSLAAVMYYALTGIAPPPSIERYDEDEIKTPMELGVQMPFNVQTALMNALNVDRAYRTQSCRDFLDELTSSQPIERAVEPKRKVDSGKMSKKTIFIIILCVLIVIGAGVAVFAIVNNSADNNALVGYDIKEDNTMSDFTGHSYYEAYETLKDTGWEITVTRQTTDDDSLQSDDIISQSVEVGTELDSVADKDKTIEFVIVKQNNNDINDDIEDCDWILMPDVTGIQQESAKEILKKYGVENVTITSEETYKASQGTVLKQSVGQDSMFDKSDTVTLTVASTPTTTTTTTTTQRATTQRNYSNSGGNSGGSSGGSVNTTGKQSTTAAQSGDGMDGADFR